MTDTVWEALAELELNIGDLKSSQIYCLCSRAILRSRAKAENWATFVKQFGYDKTNYSSEIQISNGLNSTPNLKKQEVDIFSCYCSACSASHNSADDYENIVQSTSDNPFLLKDQHLSCPLQNSDSGADLSEYFIDKSYKIHNNLLLTCFHAKSELEIAWEKFWSEKGESIIWKSWIEKYGAYINPSYLEQNALIENFNVESNEVIKEYLKGNKENNSDKLLCKSVDDDSVESLEVSKDTIFIQTSAEQVPNLKFNNYSSCGSLLEVGEFLKSNVYIDESDTEEKILKSNSFGSYASYEKFKCSIAEFDKLKGNDNERVKSRCSNTNLSVKSFANTTVTTDSMTNVTKITLSSLDLSCECESVKSSSLSSSSGDDSPRFSSASSVSSKEEMCTEADLFWKKLWKEHYENQYSLSFQKFKDNFNSFIDLNQMTSTKNCENIIGKKKLNYAPKENCNNSHLSDSFKGNFFQNFDEASLQSEMILRQSNTAKALEMKVNVKELLENSDDSFEEVEEEKNVCRKKPSYKRGYELIKENKLSKKLDNIKQAMSLMGFSFKADSDLLQSGYVKYKKKNIRAQNRRLKMLDTKPRTHLFFDDDGNPFEIKQKETEHGFLDSDGNGEKLDSDLHKSNYEFVELESLGYEAHSSSIEDGCDIIDENKKQKKKKKKLRKHSLPQEIVENKNLLKYWYRRYQLFSKFDRGIKLDTESWFSVTPEKLAKHHAERCRCDVIIDAFCGAGGNSIQFAFTCERVIAIDIDSAKIEMAKHNAKIYGVEDRIQFIVGDFIKLAAKLQADVVFLSPPWGGPEYVIHDTFDLNNILPPLGGKTLFAVASSISTNVAYFLPKNTNFTEIALLCGPGGEVEIEQNFLDRRLSSITAYFGELIMDPSDPYFESN